jgi:hypothetical protein
MQKYFSKTQEMQSLIAYIPNLTNNAKFFKTPLHKIIIPKCDKKFRELQPINFSRLLGLSPPQRLLKNMKFEFHIL